MPQQCHRSPDLWPENCCVQALDGLYNPHFLLCSPNIKSKITFQYRWELSPLSFSLKIEPKILRTLFDVIIIFESYSYLYLVLGNSTYQPYLKFIFNPNLTQIMLHLFFSSYHFSFHQCHGSDEEDWWRKSSLPTSSASLSSSQDAHSASHGRWSWSGSKNS